MKFSSKIILLAAGTAVLSSAITAGVMKEALTSHDDFASMATEASAANANAGALYKVGMSPAAAATDFTQAAESTINGVVSIKSYATKRSNGGYSNGGGGFFEDPFFEYFFGSPGGNRRQQQPRQQRQEESEEQQLGLGSGVILSADGYIVTNNHVIDGAERLEVALNDNRTFDATIIGTDPRTDLALIKIDASNLPIIPMGDSESLKVGEWVLAVGNPFGFTSTVTTGIVSAKGRSIPSAHKMGIESYIQTDAAVNPGNSGGALVNLNGELIGINTAIYSQTGNYAGYSFAIPTSIVKKIVSDLRQYGIVQRAVLGVAISDLTSELAKKHGITAVTKGVYVGEVNERSSAKEAGLQAGDVITAINGVNTDKMSELQEQLAKYRPGDTIKVKYVRDNKTYTASLKLLNQQGTTNVTKASDITDLGCAFKKVSDSMRKQLGISGGAQVVDLKDGFMREAGVRTGFIILSINNVRVSGPEDVEKIYNSIVSREDGDREMILRGIYSTGKKSIYALDLSGE